MHRKKSRSGQFTGLIAGCYGMLLLIVGQVLASTVPEKIDESAAAQRPLQFGLLPYISTRQLFAYYTPMQKYLEKTLGRPVRMSTAPDFATYIQRARQGIYDLYHTAPHFAAQAETEFAYRRVSRFLRELDGSIIVARDGPINSATDLRGRTMLTPDALAIVTFLGEQWLRDNGLQPGVDVAMKHAASHNTAILAVAHGDADAAVTSAAVFENMPQRISRQLRILTSTKKVPHMMFIAGPNLSENEYQRLRKAMLAFTADGAGKVFFETTGYDDMSKITDQDMDRLSPFIVELNAKTQPR